MPPLKIPVKKKGMPKKQANPMPNNFSYELQTFI
jgi:hypothetical protein